MKNKLLNRLGLEADKAHRVHMLKYTLLDLVKRGKRTPYTQEQFFRLTKLEHWYIRENLLKEVAHIDDRFNFNNMTA